MKIKLLFLAIVWLSTHTIYGQHACCSSGGAATISIGNNSASMLMPKNVIGVEFTNMAWFLKLQNLENLDGTVADVSYVNASTIAIHYGLFDNLSVSTILPYAFIQSKSYGSIGSGVSVETNETINGLGDMSLIARYQLPIKNCDFPKIAITGGVEMPTGKTDQDNSNVVASMGSKSWDLIFGIGLKKQSRSKKMGISFSSNYKLSTLNRDKVDFGDFWSTTIIGFYNFKSTQLGLDTTNIGKSKWFKSVSVGFMNNFLFRQIDNNSYTPNTGYSRYYSTIGGSIGIKKKITMSLNGDIPIIEKIKGAQNKTAFRLRASILITINNK